MIMPLSHRLAWLLAFLILYPICAYIPAIAGMGAGLVASDGGPVPIWIAVALAGTLTALPLMGVGYLACGRRWIAVAPVAATLLVMALGLPLAAIGVTHDGLGTLFVAMFVLWLVAAGTGVWCAWCLLRRGPVLPWSDAPPS